MASAFPPPSETRMTVQCRHARSLFSVAGGVWVFGNAGISERENLKKETVQYRGPAGPVTVAKR